MDINIPLHAPHISRAESELCHFSGLVRSPTGRGTEIVSAASGRETPRIELNQRLPNFYTLLPLQVFHEIHAPPPPTRIKSNT
jgi:hypothetical protein